MIQHSQAGTGGRCRQCDCKYERNWVPGYEGHGRKPSSGWWAYGLHRSCSQIEVSPWHRHCLDCVESLTSHSAKLSGHILRCMSVCKCHFYKKHVGEWRSSNPAAGSPAGCVTPRHLLAGSRMSLVLSFSSQKPELSVTGSNNSKADSLTVCFAVLHVKFVGDFAGFLLCTSAFICSKLLKDLQAESRYQIARCLECSLGC